MTLKCQNALCYVYFEFLVHFAFPLYNMEEDYRGSTCKNGLEKVVLSQNSKLSKLKYLQ